MVDHFRRQRPPGEPLSEEHERPATPDARAGTGAASELEELAACLAPMIESLPPADREAIDLSEIKGLTQRAASSRAGVTLSGMKSRVQRRAGSSRRCSWTAAGSSWTGAAASSLTSRGTGACEPCRSSSGVRTSARRRAVLTTMLAGVRSTPR